MTTLSPSFAADGPTSGSSRTSGPSRAVATIRSFLMLLGLEIRRSQGYWLLPVMVGIALYSSSFRSYDEPGITLWVLVNNAIMQSYVVIGSLAAALGAWLADRDRRRRTSGLLESVPISSLRRDLAAVGVAAFWGLAGYVLVGSWYASQGFMEATWGGPDVALIATGALAIILFAAIGLLAGRLLPYKVTPILVFILTLMTTVASDVFKITSTVTNQYGTYDQAQQPFKLLMPWGLVDSYPDIFLNRRAEFIGGSLLWLAGATGIVLVLLALRKQRSVVTWAALAGTIVIAAMGATPLVDRQLNPDTSFVDAVVPFEFSCQERAGFEICLHPAYEAKLDETADQVGAIFTPIKGLDGVPTRWEQSMPMEGQDREEIGMIDQVGYDYSLLNSMTSIFPDAEGSQHGQRPASQLVIMNWLQMPANRDVRGADWFGWPAEVPVVELDYGDGFIGTGPDEAALAAFQPRMDAAQERFAALPEAEQRAWLEQSWDALRAGDLALEDLP